MRRYIQMPLPHAVVISHMLLNASEETMNESAGLPHALKHEFNHLKIGLEEWAKENMKEENISRAIDEIEYTFHKGHNGVVRLRAGIPII